MNEIYHVSVSSYSCPEKSDNSIHFSVPVKILSEANNSDHWAKKKARKDEIRKKIKTEWIVIGSPEIQLPCLIKITRIATRELDFDNLVYSMRNVTNIVADLIIPGLAPGRADGDKRLKFEYLQRKVPKTYAVEIEIITVKTTP